jgi:hypothetical protein
MSELHSGKVQVRLDERGLTISLREATFFASGDAAVQPSSLPTLGENCVRSGRSAEFAAP